MGIEVSSVILVFLVCLAVNVLLLVGAVVTIDSPYILPSCRDARKKNRGKRRA